MKKEWNHKWNHREKNKFKEQKEEEQPIKKTESQQTETEECTVMEIQEGKRFNIQNLSTSLGNQKNEKQLMFNDSKCLIFIVIYSREIRRGRATNIPF